MCGIFALLGAEAAAEALKAVSARQRHRGPDGSGFFQAAGVALAHERLSIVDVDGGAQPLEARGVVLVANGEVYDYMQHRRALEDKGHVFSSDSDCEVLLHLYIEHGASFLEDVVVHGMFAFAIWDGRAETLLLGRDPIGIIPLHWARTGGVVAAASELKCLANDVPWTPRPERIEHFPPGSVFSSATQEVRRYYQPAWGSFPPLPAVPYDAAALRAALVAAVESHMMADVPFGVVLSGGLDSSLVAAIAAHVLQEKERALQETPAREKQWIPKKLITCTMGMEDSDDVKFAREVAAFIGSEHHEFVFSADEALAGLRDAVYQLETFDAAVVRPGLMQCVLARRVRELGLKVVLAGEGADEAFAGYFYCKSLTTVDEVHAESCVLLADIHQYDVQRANLSMMGHGVELRVPYLDTGFLECAMNLDPAVKMPLERHEACGPIVEKWCLRHAAALEPQLLPDSVLWREKDGMSSGVGNSYKSALDAFFDARVSDAELRGAAQRWERLTPTTKEEFYLRALFDELFGSAADASVPGLWRTGRNGMASRVANRATW